MWGTARDLQGPGPEEGRALLPSMVELSRNGARVTMEGDMARFPARSNKSRVIRTMTTELMRYTPYAAIESLCI
jgi:hypothetical protein